MFKTDKCFRNRLNLFKQELENTIFLIETPVCYEFITNMREKNYEYEKGRPVGPFGHALYLKSIFFMHMDKYKITDEEPLRISDNYGHTEDPYDIFTIMKHYSNMICSDGIIDKFTNLNNR